MSNSAADLANAETHGTITKSKLGLIPITRHDHERLRCDASDEQADSIAQAPHRDGSGQPGTQRLSNHLAVFRQGIAAGNSPDDSLVSKDAGSRISPFTVTSIPTHG